MSKPEAHGPVALTLATGGIVPAWRLPLVALTALIVLLLVGYYDTAESMVRIWIRSETFTHAFIVPPMVLWLIWRRRAELQWLKPRPVPWMVLPLALLAALWWLGSLVAVNAAMQLALTAMLVASVPTVLGWQATRVMLFPLAFLFFAVPIGEFLTPVLMQYTADFVVAAIRATGIPVYREGQQLVIPSGRWAVVEACSGIRYLMASFMVGSLFAYLNYNSLRRRLVFVGMSLLVPILANWLRAYIIVMLGHLSDNRIATGVDHLVYGWVFFGIVIMGLFFVGARWAEPEAAQPQGSPPAEPADARPRAWRTVWQAPLVAALALGVAQWPFWLPQATPETPQAAASLTLPDDSGHWQRAAEPPVNWQPAYQGASQEILRGYASADQRVGLYIGHYRHADGASAKLLSSVNALVSSTDEHWNALRTTERPLSLTSGQVLPWQRTEFLGPEYSASAQRPHLTVWRLYWVGGFTTASEVKAKLYQAWLRVQGKADDGAVIVVFSTLADAAAADRQLAAFVSANFDMVQRALSDAGTRR